MSTGAASKRPLAGLLGIFIAAMMAGLNNRVGALALADLRGAGGFGFDDASWLSTVYNAGELIAMPFAAWFAITLSVRRFELWMLATCAVLAALLPFVRDLDLLLVLRFAQGVASGTMIPILMMAALKFLPPPVRLYGLALYAMTATFAPNLSTWLAGSWTDALADWRWIYWQSVPLAALAGLLIGWGLPREPVQPERFGQANWFGMACGVPALGLLALVLDQGVRLDWFHSPLINAAAIAGCALLAVYLLSEWHHPSPFIKLQILGRRNLALGFTAFLLLLVVLMSAALLPSTHLARLHDYRPLQLASTGLVVALPQLVLGPAVAMLLYRRWVDARVVFALGLALIALACYVGAGLTPDWNREQFVLAQTLQALGQPMAVVSMLFLITSVVQPPEGPYVSGAVNTLRAFGSLVGAAVVGQLMTVRGRFHADVLIDHAALANDPGMPDPMALAGIVGQQALVLSVADAYRVLGVLALLLIPLVLRLTHIPAPTIPTHHPG
ncbi:MFS transporter [Telluria beijingensis]|uniref:MFS transporter n=1 Tax=Telluria beijingensis TaxID=3068633 RepID=UPI002795E228|nr:MFS transporter [Massilia sp. REN29]